MKTVNSEYRDDLSDGINDFYEFVMVPEVNLYENKTGVTFKGDSQEYLEAHKKIAKLLNKKGAKMCVNDRKIRILDNPKNKPIKVEIQPVKGPIGKANVKIYDVNRKGVATIMVQKVSGGELVHMRTIAFKVLA